MSNKAHLLLFGCLVIGLVVGAGVTYVFATVHYGKATVDAMLMVKEAERLESGESATEAYYKSGSRPVAIYALSQHLRYLEEDAKFRETPFTPQKAIASSMVLTHGRLAKLYAEVGQTNLSAQHVAEALDCSKRTRRTLTNEVELADFVAQMDQLIYRSRYKTNALPPKKIGATW